MGWERRFSEETRNGRHERAGAEQQCATLAKAPPPPARSPGEQLVLARRDRSGQRETVASTRERAVRGCAAATHLSCGCARDRRACHLSVDLMRKRRERAAAPLVEWLLRF